MQTELPHERLDVYRVCLAVAGLWGDVVSGSASTIAAFDHLERALDSIGVNFMRANVLPAGSAQRAASLDVCIGSAYECAASLDVCIARQAIGENAYSSGVAMLWRIRGMLLGLKRKGANAVREEAAPYGDTPFPFMRLDMYKASLESVRWTHDLMEEAALKGKTRRRLDESTTGTVLNLAEGYGRTGVADQNRFMRTAEEHVFQTLLSLDLMVARGEVTAARVTDGKAMQARIIAMLHAWCIRNEKRA